MTAPRINNCDVLAEARKRLGCGTKAIADRLGLSRSHIARRDLPETAMRRIMQLAGMDDWIAELDRQQLIDRHMDDGMSREAVTEYVDGILDRRAGRPCREPENLTAIEAGWWRGGWRDEDARLRKLENKGKLA